MLNLSAWNIKSEALGTNVFWEVGHVVNGKLCNSPQTTIKKSDSLYLQVMLHLPQSLLIPKRDQAASLPVFREVGFLSQSSNSASEGKLSVLQPSHFIWDIYMQN